MSIYIARGDDTLGPYQPAEAAALIKGGFLFPTDLAARNGDPAWVALASLLPAEDTVPAGPVAPRVPAAAAGPADARIWTAVPPFRPQWFLVGVLPVLILLAASLLLANRYRDGAHRPPRSPDVAGSYAPAQVLIPTVSPPPAVLAVANPAGAIAPPAPVASASHAVPAAPVAVGTPVPPVEAPGGEWTGTVSLTGPDGAPIKFGGVTVRVYPLEALTPMLVKKRAEVQAELDRLAPLIAAAEKERDARIAMEQSALQAFLDAGPADIDLRASRQFAHEQAKVAVADAEEDCRYYLNQRRDVMNGEVYFQDLPTPVAEAYTDPGGAFVLDLPPGGPFAVAADVRQAAENGARTRYWLVQLPTGNARRKVIDLTDANAASADSADSLIQTAD